MTGRVLSDVARLDTMVTVVDARNFPLRPDLPGGTDNDRGVGMTPTTTAPSRLLADQIEFANVIVLNKTDLVTRRGSGAWRPCCASLNPEARIVRGVKGEVDPARSSAPASSTCPVAEQAPGWKSEPRFAPRERAEEYGISSFVYEARRPFHPARLWDLLQSAGDGRRHALQGRDVAGHPAGHRRHLAARRAAPATWSRAASGGTPCPESEWPDDPELIKEVRVAWQPGVGDRRQEIVFIGLGMDQKALVRDLNACLLTNEEMRRGDPVWETYPDPFPRWPVGRPVESANAEGG
jgi:G3E family GTPase